MRKENAGGPAAIAQGENPARWRGHLDNLLPRRSKDRKVEHHAALPYAEMPAFMEKLRQQDGVAARALELAIQDRALSCRRQVGGPNPAIVATGLL